MTWDASRTLLRPTRAAGERCGNSSYSVTATVAGRVARQGVMK